MHARLLKGLSLVGFIFALLMECNSPLMARPKYIPVVSGLFTTGQWFFEGEESSMGGNAQLTFVPALRFSNRFSVLPTVRSYYRGTRSAEELAGGTVLFQDTWENQAGVKGVHNLGKKWKIRERLNLRSKLFRETTDEDWGQGLYDYNIGTVGGEVEHIFNKKVNAALGYDFSLLEFPNYVTLESGQSGDLAREFAGDNALDQRVHLVSGRSTFPSFWGISHDLQVMYSVRDYTDQAVVELTGLLTATGRQDDYVAASLSGERTFKVGTKSSLTSILYFGYTGVNSNQNHYDARLSEFIPDYYDYDQNAIGAQFTYALGGNRMGPITFNAGYSYAMRHYRQRTTQTVSGAYTNENLWSQETNLNVAFGYPLSRNLRLTSTADFGRSKSNNDYEEVYRYNFDNANYQFGFTYEY
jgi:hypothetical protein